MCMALRRVVQEQAGVCGCARRFERSARPGVYDANMKLTSESNQLCECIA